MRTVRSRLTLALSASLAATSAHAVPVDTAFPAFGAAPACYASALSGDTLFLAGSLRWAGPLTGGGVPVHASDLTPLAGFPHVNGRVLAATSDGAGGWFIGGTFTHVGGLPRANLAHILADLRVDGWSPGTNGDVITVLGTPSEVYFCGTFTSVNGQPSSGFAGVSRATGSLVLNPAVNGLVAALASDGTRLFIGGEFTNVKGGTCSRLASFELSDHSLRFWYPAANDGVYALRCANGVVYAGGRFTSVAGLSRGGLVALDPVDAVPTAWDPQAGATFGYGVRAILPVGDRVYVGGDFSQMGGAPRLCLAAVDAATGALTPWDPQVRNVRQGAGSAIVTSLEMAGNDLLAGGEFEQVGGIARSDLVRLDTTTAAAVLPSPEAPGEARALAASGANVLVGGRFTTLGPSRRGDLVAVRASTGELLPWSPDATRDVIESLFGNKFLHLSTIVKLAVDAERVYVVISFHDSFQGSNRQMVRALSRSSGTALWSIEPFGPVKSLAVMDSLLIVGGDFFSPATGLLAYDARTGAGAAWGGTTSGGAVLALQPTPAGLVVGGEFTTAGGQPRARLALLDRTSGLATSWDPGADGAVAAFALAGPRLYCGGEFGMLGGEPRTRLGALSLETGAATAWNPGANASVESLAFDQGMLLAGGAFTTAGGQPRVCVAALDPETGAALPWDGAVGIGHRVYSVGSGGGHLFAGGTHVTAGSEPTLGFTAFAAPDPVLDVPEGRPRPVPGVIRVDPQPARTVESVRLRLPRETDAEIGLYDLTGRRLAVLEPWGHRPAGEVTVALGARQLKPGIYIVRAITPDGDIAGRLVVIP